MPEKHPFHSDDSFFKGEDPVQSFVDVAHPVTDEERNRPRYGRPTRKPSSEQTPETPSASEQPPSAE